MKYLLTALSMLCVLPLFLQAEGNETTETTIEQKDCNDSLICHYQGVITTQLDSAKISVNQAKSDNLKSKNIAQSIEKDYYIRCCK